MYSVFSSTLQWANSTIVEVQKMLRVPDCFTRELVQTMWAPKISSIKENSYLKKYFRQQKKTLHRGEKTSLPKIGRQKN